MNEKDTRAILYGYLAESETTKLALIKTQKYTTNLLLDELLPTFDVSPEAIEVIRILHEARTNLRHFEIRLNGLVAVGFSDPNDFEFLIHLYSALYAGFKYLYDNYDTPSLADLRKLHNKEETESMVNSYLQRLDKIKNDYNSRKALNVDPRVFITARRAIDLIVHHIVGDKNQEILALRFNEDIDVLLKIEEDFKPEPN